MSLQIDSMMLEDVPVIADLEARQHLTPWPLSGFQDALRQGWHARVLRDAGQFESKVLGYFVAMSAGDDEELLTLTVAPASEGQGYGRQLLDVLLHEARQRGAQRLFLEVRQSNRRAIGLYESAGFTITGMRKNYYATLAKPAQGACAKREDAVLMMRALQEQAA